MKQNNPDRVELCNLRRYYDTPKGEDNTKYKEVLFNTDTLYLTSIDLLNVALACKRFGVLDDDALSVIKKSAYISVKEIATVERIIIIFN